MDKKLRLVDEAPDWLVVDKPPHVAIHPSKPGETGTVWNLLKEVLAYEVVNGGQVSIINRLDRDTSGLVLVAKTASAARRFCKAMERREFHKEYTAVVAGWPADDYYEIDAPLCRQGLHMPSRVWVRQIVHPAGAQAATRVSVERRFRRPDGAPFAIVRAEPLTGRMHQIRVHLAHIGHPVVGDKIYGPGEEFYLRFIETGWTPELERALLLPRQALHSSLLRLEGDPRLEWRSPFPADLREWVDHNLLV